jgi:hypothetical protein
MLHPRVEYATDMTDENAEQHTFEHQCGIEKERNQTKQGNIDRGNMPAS